MSANLYNYSQCASSQHFSALVEKIRRQLDAILETQEWEFGIKAAVDLNFSDKLELGTYTLTVCNGVAEKIIAKFTLTPMVNCCGICVSTQAWVHDEYRGKGLGTLLNSIRIDIARYLGYGLLLCTDVEQNAPQRKILQANGWQDIYKFINPRTHNAVYISVINL